MDDEEVDELENEDDQDLDRLPCPDGSCVGIAGPDGCCTECGTYIGEVSAEPCPDNSCGGFIGEDGRCTECGAEADDGDDDIEDGDEYDDHEELLGADADDDGDEDEERVPCSDGSCIGIIGPDGRCTECGQKP